MQFIVNEIYTAFSHQQIPQNIIINILKNEWGEGSGRWEQGDHGSMTERLALS